MANARAIWQQYNAHTTYQLSPSYSIRPTPKGPSLNEKCRRIFWREKNQQNGPLTEKRRDRTSNGIRYKSKRGDTKGEWNDSPEIETTTKKRKKQEEEAEEQQQQADEEEAEEEDKRRRRSRRIAQPTRPHISNCAISVFPRKCANTSDQEIRLVSPAGGKSQK